MQRSLKRSDFTCYANLMRFWSDYIHYFVQILLKLSLTWNFNVSFIFYFNFDRRIKCGEKVWFVLAQFIWGRSTVCKLRSLWTKNNCRKKSLLFYSNSHGKQNAPSRYLEYASQGNLFSQLHTKWRLEFEHSTDTGKSNSSPGFHTFSMNVSLSWSEYELISLKTKAISYWEQSSFRQTGSPRTMVYKSKSCLPP